MAPVLITLILLGFIHFLYRSRMLRLEREQYIRRYTFGPDIFARVRERYPHLEEKDLYLVARALREYFLVYLRAKGQMIGMPSRVVDAMWHEFILDTRAYMAFCERAFGRFLHHLPASSTQKGVAVESRMKLTLRLACLEENINPANPVRLPLLFAIDEKLNIPGGNVYRMPVNGQAGSDSGSGGCGGVACGGSTSDAAGCSGDGGCGGGCGGGD